MTPEKGPGKSNFHNLFEKVFDASASTEVLTLAGELSTRKYYRILVKNPTGQQTTPSYVLQAAESFQDPEQHPFLIAQQIFAHIGIRVPKIFGVAGQEGWILVEDCGDFFLQNRQDLELYMQALEMLYALQKCKNPASVGITGKLAEAPHWKWAFDFEKLNAEMFHTEKFFVAGLAKEKVPFAAWLSENSQYLAERPRVLCHRDFHSRNLLVRDNLLYALDFQDARMGPVSYDLVSIVWDPYAYLKEGFRSLLLQEWKAKLAPEFSEEIDIEIHRMKIQRLTKAIGSYSSFYLDRGNPSCFVFIEEALADTIESFESLNDSGVLTKDEKKAHNWLNKVYEEIAEK